MKVYPLHNNDDVEYEGMMTSGIYLHGKLQTENGVYQKKNTIFHLVVKVV